MKKTKLAPVPPRLIYSISIIERGGAVMLFAHLPSPDEVRAEVRRQGGGKATADLCAKIVEDIPPDMETALALAGAKNANGGISRLIDGVCLSLMAHLDPRDPLWPSGRS
jgi:hypothetical protein